MTDNSTVLLRIKRSNSVYVFLVVAMFPATIMSIAFLKDGLMPPPAPIMLILFGLSALFYRIDYCISAKNTSAVKIQSLYGINVLKKNIPKTKIEGIGIATYQLEGSVTEKNEYTNQYETTGTGTYSTYHYPYLKIDGKKLKLAGFGNGKTMKDDLRSVAQSVGVKFII